MSNYEHIIQGCNPFVDLTLRDEEMKAVLKAHDYGIQALDDEQMEFLRIVLAKMKDQIWP